MKFTQWFRGHINPARRGVYQRKYLANRILYCYWDGRKWYRPDLDALAAMTSFDDRALSLNQKNISWRGIAK